MAEPSIGTATPDGAVFDAAALARLQATLDPDGRHRLLPRVFDAYRTLLVDVVAQLGGAVDAHRIAELAHKLKSSSAQLGATALAAACVAAEARWRDADAATPVSLVAADAALLQRLAQQALEAADALAHD